MWSDGNSYQDILRFIIQQVNRIKWRFLTISSNEIHQSLHKDSNVEINNPEKKRTSTNTSFQTKCTITQPQKTTVRIKSDRYNHLDHSVDEYSIFIYENFQTPINERLQWWGKILENKTEAIKPTYLEMIDR